ncbi:unnamed protein product [Prunus armeniaca]
MALPCGLVKQSPGWIVSPAGSVPVSKKIRGGSYHRQLSKRVVWACFGKGVKNAAELCWFRQVKHIGKVLGLSTCSRPSFSSAGPLPFVKGGTTWILLNVVVYIPSKALGVGGLAK